MWRCDLCAVLPVYFVSVILAWIMACRNYNTCNTSKFPNRKGQLRCRTQGFKTVGFDTICIQAERCLIGKLRGHDTGIISDRNSLVLSVLRNDIVCQSLGCLTNRINIHTVCSCADYPAQTTSTKLQLTVKTILDLCIISL